MRHTKTNNQKTKKGKHKRNLRLNFDLFPFAVDANFIVGDLSLSNGTLKRPQKNEPLNFLLPFFFFFGLFANNKFQQIMAIERNIAVLDNKLFLVNTSGV